MSHPYKAAGHKNDPGWMKRLRAEGGSVIDADRVIGDADMEVARESARWRPSLDQLSREALPERESARWRPSLPEDQLSREALPSKTLSRPVIGRKHGGRK